LVADCKMSQLGGAPLLPPLLHRNRELHITSSAHNSNLTSSATPGPSSHNCTMLCTEHCLQLPPHKPMHCTIPETHARRAATMHHSSPPSAYQSSHAHQPTSQRSYTYEETSHPHIRAVTIANTCDDIMRMHQRNSAYIHVRSTTSITATAIQPQPYIRQSGGGPGPCAKQTETSEARGRRYHRSWEEVPPLPAEVPGS
jgi:hypothetical protein